MTNRPISLRALPLAALALLALSLGCSEPKPTPAPNKRAGASARPSSPQAPPPAAVKLTVLIADDEQLAEGVRLLRGEWKARSGGELEVESVNFDNLKQDRLAADVLIFPSRQLGNFVEQSSLRPMRDSVLTDPYFGLADVFPAIRQGEMRYGDQTWALPLGSPPLLAAYREDLVQFHGGSPPTSWTEYRRLIDLAPKAPVNEWEPTSVHVALPLRSRDAAYPLIARALAYTDSHLRGEALFDPADMRPRIADPAFVRALAEITAELATRNELDIKQPPATLADAIRKLRSGGAGLAFGWPGLEADAVEPAARSTLVMAPLPMADQVYSTSQNDWVNQLNPASVTLLGVEGRLVAVTAATRNAVSAFQLARWLTTGNVAVGLSSRSSGTLWFRRSQTALASKWAGDHGRDDDDGAAVATEALQTESPWLVPRIPAVDDYLEALAEAVRTAQSDETKAQEALDAATAKWEELTERMGREAQARAYRRHLGIESFEPVP